MARIVPEGGFRLKPFKTSRQVNLPHSQFIKSLPCAACLTAGIQTFGCDPAHIRTGSRPHGKSETGGGERPSDRWCLPLCRRHHDQQHSMAERNFWSMYRIDPFLLALVLWGLTGDEYAAVEAIKLHARGA